MRRPRFRPPSSPAVLGPFLCATQPQPHVHAVAGCEGATRKCRHNPYRGERLRPPARPLPRIQRPRCLAALPAAGASRLSSSSPVPRPRSSRLRRLLRNMHRLHPRPLHLCDPHHRCLPTHSQSHAGCLFLPARRQHRPLCKLMATAETNFLVPLTSPAAMSPTP